MPEALGRLVAFLREKQILHRLGVVISLSIIAFAFYILFHIVKKIDSVKLLHALRETDLHSVAWAALAVAAGYFTLTFYDLFALRTIGRNDVPYRIAALAGFTSYAVGHNVGASVFTGGAVRYRVYSAWNLDAIEVAKICFIAGLTFWLGNATVLGLGILIHPEAIHQLPVGLSRAFAMLILALLLSYIVWVWIKPRQVGGGQWTVTLPGGPLTLLQIVIGIVDLGFCSLAMYMLVPAAPHVDFITIAVIFVTATLLGFASHSPGGLGVFDTAMLVGLWHFDKAELLAGLLLFRILYYITPFAISLAILAIRELAIGVRRRRQIAREAALVAAIAPSDDQASSSRQ
jgi:glycosyltransferase 2 family protein